MAGTEYRGSELKDVDQFVKDKAGLDSEREKERLYGSDGLGRFELA